MALKDGYQPNMEYQVTVRQGTVPHKKAERGNQVKRKGTQKQEKSQRQTPFQLSMTYFFIKLLNLN